VVRKRALSILAEHLADKPTTILISTHNIQELESLADHVGVLREGRLVAQMPRDELQRTVRSYELDVPLGWEPPRELQPSAMRRANAGRVLQCVLIGEERDVTRLLGDFGVRVRQVNKVTLEDAALAFLPEEPS
jgi:ABC-2 type transport system ATP-binding protein